MEAAAGQAIDVDLAPPAEAMAPSPRENLTTPVGMVRGAVVEIERLGVPRPPPPGPAVANPPWAVSFYVAKRGMRYVRADASAIRAEVVEDGGPVVRIKVVEAELGAFVIQAQIGGQVPLNVVLPLGPEESGCEVTATIVGNDVVLGAYPGSPRAMLAARFLAAGDMYEGSQVITSEQAEGMVQAKGQDPVAAAIAAYLLLRSGELERLHDWPTNLARIDWLADGAVIAAEMAALRGNYDSALSYLTQAVERGLPIFTDGYSLLVSRLRQLARGERQRAEPKTLHGRWLHSWAGVLRGQGPHTSSGDDELVPRHVRRGAHHMLVHVLEWAPFIDFAAPTVTFRASDPSDPDNSQLAVASPDGVLKFRGTTQVAAG